MKVKTPKNAGTSASVHKDSPNPQANDPTLKLCGTNHSGHADLFITPEQKEVYNRRLCIIRNAIVTEFLIPLLKGLSAQDEAMGCLGHNRAERDEEAAKEFYAAASRAMDKLIGKLPEANFPDRPHLFTSPEYNEIGAVAEEMVREMSGYYFAHDSYGNYLAENQLTGKNENFD